MSTNGAGAGAGGGAGVSTVPLWIGGKAHTEGPTFDVKHPGTGQTVASVTATDGPTLERAIEAAHDVYKTQWKDVPANTRRDVLMKVADLLEQRKETFWDAYKHDTSVSQLTLMGDIAYSTGHVKKAATIATEIKGEIPQTADGSMALVLREPYGVVLSVSPYNFGLTLTLRSIVYPLACGNTVVMKASPLIPSLSYALGQLFKDAGLPDGALQIVQFKQGTDAELMEKAIAHPLVRFVNFTGSNRVGSIIGSLAGKHIKPSVLELGGKAPAIVFESADLPRAANNIVFGAMIHAGQVCMATETAIVVESAHDAFVAELKKVAEGELAKEPFEIAAQVGVDKLKSLVKDAEGKGAKRLVEIPDGTNGALGHVPVILTDVTPSMDIYATETFGPAMIVVKAKDEADAIRLANNEYGLTSAVWTNDYKQALRVAKQLESSAVHINSPSVHDEADLPHGGHKGSGYGRFNGMHAGLQFTQTKTITMKEPSDMPIGMLR